MDHGGRRRAHQGRHLHRVADEALPATQEQEPVARGGLATSIDDGDSASTHRLTTLADAVGLTGTAMWLDFKAPGLVLAVVLGFG